ncbi:hypothetical protein KUTeg_003476 [Tegillarca granosa]|uniref:Aquaporin n=1 Tax=Tegillarca granosa TaxID=220873 RepID=A0ABQ9FQ48_TEGGR|nr:hypothetical protein KUTeg_003476 [Tegillarca granosa]
MAELDRLIHEEKMEMYSRNTYTDYVRPVIAEFTGVCLFVFVGVLSVNGAGGNIVAVALAHGMTIALLIMGLGNISGGHFNPAVTLGVAITGNIKLILAVAYLLAQTAGGLLGAAFVRAILTSTEYKNISGGAQVLQSTDTEPGWAILCEGILTFILVFTVLMNAVDVKTKNNLAPLAIGFTVAVDILAGGKVTGASMNPARTFGPTVVASPLVDGLWLYHYVYWTYGISSESDYLFTLTHISHKKKKDH